MMEKLGAFWNVFRKGQAVANPEAWKHGQITAGMVAALLAAAVALGKAFGYALPVSDDQLVEIGGAIVTVFGVYQSATTVISSEKVGLPALPPRPSLSDLPTIPATVQPTVPPVGQPVLGPGERLAANGDITKPINRDA